MLQGRVREILRQGPWQLGGGKSDKIVGDHAAREAQGPRNAAHAHVMLKRQP